MTTAESSDASAAARARGNEFYSKGKLLDAEKAYQQAVSLAPDDPSPLSNLSAVAFEKGQYPSAIIYAQKALVLSGSEPEDGGKKQRLYGRLAKCHLHALDLNAAEEMARKLTDSAEKESLLASAEGLKRARGTPRGATAYSGKIADRLPRYRPYLNDTAEYFPVGHDPATSLFDGEMAKTVRAKDDVSFLFCGSGDARNVLATISDIGLREFMRGKGVCNKIHITLVDHKPAMIARTLLVLDLLFRYVILKATKNPRCEDALIVLAYIFSCQFIPPFAAEKLQEHIEHLIESVEEGSFMVPFLHLATESRPHVARVLRQWQQPLGDAYSVANIRVNAQPQIEKRLASQEEFFGSQDSSPTNEIDRRSFKELMVLLPPDEFTKHREPALVDFVAAYKRAGPGQHTQLQEYIDAEWKPNATLFDADFEAGRSVITYSQVAFSPLTVLKDLGGEESDGASSAIEIIGQSFSPAGLAMLNLSERLVIEAIASEMSDAMDRIRLGNLEDRRTAPSDPKAPDPTTFPDQYDRIHMSNIPDYVGGHLSAFSYGQPLLRENRTSSLQFNNLLNPPMFETHAHFESEYLLMDDERRISEHFGVERIKKPAPPPIPGVTSFMRENYMEWRRVPKTPIPFKRRLPRVAFETWMQGHLLKICLPYPRPVFSSTPVFSPLNLTSFFRLLLDMYEVGYPAHWLSGVLAQACSETIATMARAPRTLTVQPEALRNFFASAKTSVEPWRAELTTLLSVWCPVLPWGVLVPSETLVPLSSVVECSTAFPKFENQNGNLPHFMVLFWNTEVNGAKEPPKDIRRLLLDDEVGDMSDLARRTRAEGVHCITAFSWSPKTRTVTYWLREDVVTDMVKGAWKVYIWRTDTWMAVTTGVDAATGIVKGRSWE
ncbi:tetratricopeptide [Thozetella sp. PMI_491]|nr:tetratricopeptide [Thozetella sp. PMI_491]